MQLAAIIVSGVDNDYRAVSIILDLIDINETSYHYFYLIIMTSWQKLSH